MRLKYVKLNIKLLESLADQSKDSRLKVGALLLKDGRVVSTGYNGQLSGEPHSPVMQNSHDISTIHAEMNIICFCAKNNISTNNTTLFVTHTPCQICTKLLIQAGIKEVFYLHRYREDENPFMNKIKMTKLEKSELI